LMARRGDLDVDVDVGVEELVDRREVLGLG
jgi:hypothetical protein